MGFIFEGAGYAMLIHAGRQLAVDEIVIGAVWAGLAGIILAASKIIRQRA